MIQIKIGSAPANNVVLTHPSVSPFHLEIVQDDQGNFLLTDLNSVYGTTVNGYRIQGMVQLRKTDIVKAGELVLPWTSYFAYQGNENPAPNYIPPVTENFATPNYTSPVSPPAPPEKPKNKKKLLLFIGGGVLLALLGIVALIYMYTRPSHAHLKLIPSNAFIVVSADLKGIAGKIDLEKMKKLEFFQDMKDQAHDRSDVLSKALSDPFSSGVDVFSQPYAFMTIENKDYMRFTGGIVFAIKNESNFSKFISKISHDEEIKQSDKFKIVTMDEGSCVAWNDDAGIILFSDKSHTRTKNYCKNLFEQDEKESILSIESFTKFRDAKYDIGFFLNYDAFHSIPGFSLPTSMRGGSSMATINFNDGKLSYTNEYFMSADSSSSKGMLGKKGINDALKSTIPGKSYGIASVSLDLLELYKYMDKDARMADVLDDMARNFNMDRKKLPGILTGDFYVSLADVKPLIIPRMRFEYDYETDHYGYVESKDTMLMPSYIVAGTVKDVPAFEGILARWEGKDTTNGIRFWTTYRQGNYYLAKNASNYFFTDDFSLAESLSRGKAATQVSGNMAALISNDPVYSYFNLNMSKYPATVPQYLEENMGHRDFNDFETFMDMFDYTELTGDGTKQTLDVYFVDKGNCLNTFINTGNEMYLNHNKY
jgi:hypothetical protein